MKVRIFKLTRFLAKSKWMKYRYRVEMAKPISLEEAVSFARIKRCPHPLRICWNDGYRYQVRHPDANSRYFSLEAKI
jgi:hypothetical protein